MSVEGSRVDVHVSFVWDARGRISFGARRKIEFPEFDSVPGLYRISLVAARGRVRRYIGETVNLRRRFHGYRHPGPTQQTNQRVHDLLISWIDHGDSAEVAVCTEATVAVGDEELSQLDLTLKYNRLLAENAALLAAYRTGDADIENQ